MSLLKITVIWIQIFIYWYQMLKMVGSSFVACAEKIMDCFPFIFLTSQEKPRSLTLQIQESINDLLTTYVFISNYAPWC